MNDHRIECLRITRYLVERLSRAAQRERTGVFWPCLKHRASLPALSADLSLAYGTPGVALFLSDYYAHTGEGGIRDLVEQSLLWIEAAIMERKPSHGFYAGHPGALYTYLSASRAIGCDISGGKQAWIEEMFHNLCRDCGNRACNVFDGIGGTLLAISAIHRQWPSLRLAELAPSVIKALCRRARVTHSGAYWDRYREASGPAIGFLFGNAGVEYALSAFARDSADDAVRMLVNSAQACASAQYDASLENWRCHYPFPYSSAPNEARLLRAAARGRIKQFIHLAGSDSWQDGAAGILLSRVATDRINQSSKGHDTERAIMRLEAAIAKATPSSSFALASGLGGVLLALRAAHSQYSTTIPNSFASAVSACCVRYSSSPSPMSTEEVDYSLFEGDAGLAYLLLQVACAPASSATILNPLTSSCISGAPLVSSVAGLQEITSRMFPTTTKLSVPSAATSGGFLLTLESVLSLMKSNLRTLPARQAFYFEADALQWEESSISYKILSYQEQYNIRLYRNRYALIDDNSLGRLRVALAPSVKIRQVPHRPSEVSVDLGLGTFFVLQEHCWHGIRQSVLPEATYVILSSLHKPLFIDDLIEKLIAKYQLDVVTGAANVRKTVLEQIRIGLKAGYLCVRPRSLAEQFISLRRWITGR